MRQTGNALKRDKPGDAMGQPSWRSSFLGDPNAKLFCGIEPTRQHELEILPHQGLRFALNASPFGRRRASLRPGAERGFTRRWGQMKRSKGAKSS